MSVKSKKLKVCEFCGIPETETMLSQIGITVDATGMGESFFFRLEGLLCGLCSRELNPYEAMNRITKSRKDS